ncbi:MAG: hypothetical protein ABF318_00590 [Ketobacter sp.]|nr:hypothetical protein [Pseudomonadales bacterium]
MERSNNPLRRLNMIPVVLFLATLPTISTAATNTLFLHSQWPKEGVPILQFNETPTLENVYPERTEQEVSHDRKQIEKIFSTIESTFPTDKETAYLNGLGIAKYEVSISAKKDPMVAVGLNFIVTTNTGSISILDKNAKPVPGKNGVYAVFSASTLFGEFIDRDSPLDLNKHTGFRKPCDFPEYPETSGNKFCIDEFYDTRVFFDQGAKRFIILSQARNRIWSDTWRPNGATKFSGVENGVRYCGEQGIKGSNETVPLTSTSYCKLARRHQLFAISKTEDPRNGFYIYALKKQNYEDWPWGAVNPAGDTFTIGHASAAMDIGAAVTVIRLSDMRSGTPQPRYFQLTRDDLIAAHPAGVNTADGPYSKGLYNPAPIAHHGPAQSLHGYTLILSRVDHWSKSPEKNTTPSQTDSLRVFGYPKPTAHGVKPKVVYGETVTEDAFLPGFMMHSVYRDGHVHVSWESVESASKNRQLRYLDLPISASSKGITFPISTRNKARHWVSGYVDKLNLFPTVAVNSAGKLIIPYVRGGGAQIRVHRWVPTRTAPADSLLLHLSSADWKSRNIDYSWATVDPTDDQTFWFSQMGVNNAGSLRFYLFRVKGGF